MFPKFQMLPGILLLSILSGVLTPDGSALDRPDVTKQDTLRLASRARSSRVHSAHRATETAPLSLIAQVRFNQQAVSFEHGVTAGPGAGNLEVQFAGPASGTFDHLRYRLFGFDTDWKDAENEREILYPHLAPGRYEFDFQQTKSGSSRGSVLEGIAITVTPPYWQTGWFRSLCMIVLVLLILALHKLRVRYLLRQARKLEETVTQTKAELTLAGRIAADAQEALKEQALKDGLTGLWNRKTIFAMLEREVCRAQRDRFPITLLMLDLDHFKSINDTYGHLTGDEVLREAANRLVEAMRSYDFAGRYGGEEFLVVLPSCPSHSGVHRAEDFRRAIAERPVSTTRGLLPVTCSLGVAAYDNTMPPEELIRRADEALYRAKHQGRNCVCAGN